MAVNTARPGVGGEPNIKSAPRKRVRLVRVHAARGANQGGPPSESMNIFPFPFSGTWEPARHGHHPLWPLGAQRRVGAWRTGVGLGTSRVKRYGKNKDT